MRRQQQQQLHINYTLVWMRSLALMVQAPYAHPRLLGLTNITDADARQRLSAKEQPAACCLLI